MALSQANAELLAKLRFLHTRALAGDPEARQDAAKLKAAAKAGDPRARLAFNTLAALHWQSQMPAWKAGERFYAALLKDDPRAQAKFAEVRSRVSRRDPAALSIFATLKAIHNQRKSSVWYPGAPQTGYYPMPKHHRPGIEIGGYPGASGTMNWARRVGFGGVAAPFAPKQFPGGFPASRGWPQRVGFGSDMASPTPWDQAGLLASLGLPGNIPSMPGMPGSYPNSNIPGIPSNILPGYGIPGLSVIPGLPGYVSPPQAPPDLSSFLPLTPQAVQGLLGLIQQAISMPGPYLGPGIRSTNPMGTTSQLQPPSIPQDTSTPPAMTSSTTPAPSGMNLSRLNSMVTYTPPPAPAPTGHTSHPFLGKRIASVFDSPGGGALPTQPSGFLDLKSTF